MPTFFAWFLKRLGRICLSGVILLRASHYLVLATELLRLLYWYRSDRRAIDVSLLFLSISPYPSVVLLLRWPANETGFFPHPRSRRDQRLAYALSRVGGFRNRLWLTVRRASERPTFDINFELITTPLTPTSYQYMCRLYTQRHINSRTHTTLAVAKVCWP